MKIIDLGEISRRVTVLSYGAMRTGKSRFAGSFPRPVFLSDSTESGWTTLQNVDPGIFFESDHRPEVWSLEKAPDMPQAISELEQIVRNAPGKFLTVVIDSLTFYADSYFNFMDFNARQGNRTPDSRLLYSALAAHLRDIRIRIHNLGLNVVWICLEKTPTADEPHGGPMLSGQNAAKFAAGCDYILYHRSFMLNPTAALQWDIRTRKFNQYPAGGRDEGKLMDPLGYVADIIGDDGVVRSQWVPDCTYRTFAQNLGITAEQSLIPNPPSNTQMPTKPVPQPIQQQPQQPLQVSAQPVRKVVTVGGKPVVTPNNNR